MKMYNSYLSHHGIKGQKWGIKNGPPYPIEKQVNKYFNNKQINEGKRFLDDKLNMPIDLQFFANKKNHTFKWNSKEEYAIVNSAFINDVSKEDKKKDILSKSININDKGAWTYTAKNLDGNGNFRVIRRKKIKDSSTKLFERDNNG